jgi:iron(III) transport system permease protein
MIGESFSEEGRVLFKDYLESAVYQKIIQNTIVMGLAVASIGTVVGFFLAYVQVKVKVPFKRFMHIIALVPIISPPFAVATATLILFGRSGIITYRLFDIRYNIYGIKGLTLVMALSFFPIAYINFKGLMQTLDPALDEASTNLGASKWHTFRTVTFPMLIPGIASAFLLIFVESIADLGNPLVMGGNYEVLSTRIYVSVIGLYNTTAAAVLSIILLAPSLTVFLIQRYWVSRLSVITVTGKPTGTPQLVTHNGVRWSFFAIAMFITLFIILVYGTIGVGAFTEILGVKNNFTLSHFDFIINGIGSEATTDTTTFSIIATPIAGLIGMIVAFLIVRKQFFGRDIIDFSIMLGIAVPGTIIGIGYILVFNTPTVLTLPFFDDLHVQLLPKLTGSRAVFGGAAAIVMVFVIRSVPAALRSGIGALTQIDPSIEEASTSLGANSIYTFRTITLPLIRPAFLAGLIYAFARSMTSISAIIFLTTPRTRIMTAQILNEVQNARYGNAFAYCVILILIVLAAIAFMYVTVGSTSGAERPVSGG